MKKSTLKLIVTIIIGLTFIGCAANNEKINIKESKLTQDKSKAYVVFMRPDTYAGSAHYPRILEYIPEQKSVKFVGELSIGEKIIYPVSAGVHYFYTDYISNSINKINAIAGKTYYIDINRLAFNPNLEDNSFLKYQKLLKTEKCNTKILDKLMFQEHTPIDNEQNEQNDILIMQNNNSKNTIYKSPIFIELHCNNKKIVKIKEYMSFYTIDELKEDTELVKPSQNSIKYFEENKDNFINEVNDFFPEWKAKLEDIPYTDFWTHLKINKLISDKDYKKAKGINLIQNKHFVDNDNIKVFENKLNQLFPSSKDKETVTVKYTILKEANGSQLGRYLQVGFTPTMSSVASIHVKFEFFNSEKQLISSIEISDLLTGGLLGGFNTLDNNILKIFEEYVKRNILE